MYGFLSFAVLSLLAGSGSDVDEDGFDDGDEDVVMATKSVLSSVCDLLFNEEALSAGS